MRKLILAFIIGLQFGIVNAQHRRTGIQPTITPDLLYGQLFIDVQMQNALKDGKTFVDCLPKRDPQLIVRDYLKLKATANKFNLKSFVEANFVLPDSGISATPEAAALLDKTPDSTANQPLVTHIHQLWTALGRTPKDRLQHSSLLDLPHPYIVPGGRFREIYYWDSYFTMLGLQVSGENETIENMVKNFAFLIDQYGHIPNGNRNYYLSRSQPPFFSLMVDLLKETQGEEVYLSYLPALEKEYAYWMDKSAPTKHVVKMSDGSQLNRYYDQLNTPRQESYKEDVLIAQEQGNNNPEIYRDIRSAAESGWDFSSRWFRDPAQLKTIQTTQIVPVDLNCLLYHLELTLEKCYALKKDIPKERLYKSLALKRRNSIQKYFWSPKQGFYTDYNISTKKLSPQLSLAGTFPLFFNIADIKQAKAVGTLLKKQFLKPGGLITTLQNYHQQWDAPNGWAPLQYIAIKGMENYGYKEAAKDFASRWVALNAAVYKRTGKLMEKYNVVDTHLEAGEGEYTAQDGFGWTNGVLLALIKHYDLTVE
ncbi:alpha,alpha-trehalase TreA [Pedobacter sp. AW31-3R]|uniref:alpha,alpha-trehalase TreA n=1 Tax=Pedobacter sp. AW31-3R TaxID=3445781 RepID=UPI003FA0F268